MPGAKWLRCDLHVHTPFDHEKKFDKPEIKQEVNNIMEGSAEAFRLRKERYGY